MFSWIDPIGEYALKLCCCLFNKKTRALLISFFKYYAWKPMHIWALQNLNMAAWVTIVNLSNCESTGPL